MKRLKGLISVLCAVVMSVSLVSIVGCGGGSSDADKVMTLSLNPEVEFILDGNDKVVTVNALNEEGNLIISASAFDGIEGKSAQDAVELFLQVSKDTGFLVKGNLGTTENEIDISISGDNVKTLFDKVKQNAEEYLTEENIKAKIEEVESITKEELQELVEKCSPYLEEAEVKAMEYKELIKELAESRKETAEFYSQELKNAYYEAKAFALEQVEYETLKSKANSIMQGVISGVGEVYIGLVDAIEQTRLNLLVKENSAYQVALKTFMNAKAEYLNYRNYVAGLEQTAITAQISEKLAYLQNVIDNAEDGLENAKETANNALDTAKKAIKDAYDAVLKAIETASIKVGDYIDEISTAQKTAVINFTTEFESGYSSFNELAKNTWSEMRTALEKGYTAE